MNIFLFSIFHIFYLLFLQKEIKSVQITTKRYAPETTPDVELDQYYPHVAEFVLNTSGVRKEYTMTFDTSSELTWIVNNDTNNTNETITVIPNEKLEGIFNYSNISLPSQYLNISNVQVFNVPNKKLVNYDGVIGLPRKYEREESEIIGEEGGEKEDYFHYFYPAWKLKKKEIIISFIHDKNYGKIYLGEYDSLFFDFNINNCKCNCTSNYPNYNQTNNPTDFWNCLLSNYSIKGVTEEAPDLALFSLSNEYIISPYRYMNYILNNISDYFGRRGTCLKSIQNPLLIKITCEKDNKLKGLEISFGFKDGLNLTIGGDYLFKKHDESKVELKIAFFKDQNIKYWIMGEPIMRQYNLLFIKNDTFEEGVIIVSRAKEYGITLLIVAFSCGILFLIIFIIIFIHYKSHETKRRINNRAANTLVARDFKDELDPEDCSPRSPRKRKVQFKEKEA